ncbi:MAG: molybdenum cofactor biosynthesis protein [Bryobacteraceae bacterium]
MFVRVLFFGVLKDIAGRPEDTLELPDGATIASVFEHYAERYPRLRQAAPSIVFARNRQFSDRGTPVMPGDEVAFLPPVSGGAAGLYSAKSGDPVQGTFFALTREPIDTSALGRQILRGEDGALVNFEGVVRNNTNGRSTRFLDYECYEPMALQVMANIGKEIAQRHAIGRIAMVHRLGRMEVGETSVAVLVTAPHRKPAFEAALEGINRLKKLVPIWKKEHFADGEVWVEGEWDESVLAR